MTMYAIMVSPQANRNLYGKFNTRRCTSVQGFCFFKLFLTGIKEVITYATIYIISPKIASDWAHYSTHCWHLPYSPELAPKGT